jgi:hypothetical protein
MCECARHAPETSQVLGRAEAGAHPACRCLRARIGAGSGAATGSMRFSMRSKAFLAAPSFALSRPRALIRSATRSSPPDAPVAVQS